MFTRRVAGSCQYAAAIGGMWAFLACVVAEADPPVETEKPAAPRVIRDGDALKRTRETLLKGLSEEGYRLDDGALLKRIDRPFPAIRGRYYSEGHPDQAEHIPQGPSSILFVWKDGKLNEGSMYFGDSDGPGRSLDGILIDLLGMPTQRLEGAAPLLLKPIPGDWVVAADARLWPDRVAVQLETMLKHEFELNVRLQFRDVLRPVYVARGDYAYKALPNPRLPLPPQHPTRPASDLLEVFGEDSVRNSGRFSSGRGDLGDFFNYLGHYIGASIIDESSTQPSVQFLDWRHHVATNAQTWKEDPDRILPNITKQTGLTFTKEDRLVQILFVKQR